MAIMHRHISSSISWSLHAHRSAIERCYWKPIMKTITEKWQKRKKVETRDTRFELQQSREEKCVCNALTC